MIGNIRIFVLIFAICLGMGSSSVAKAGGAFSVQFTIFSDKEEVYQFVQMLKNMNYPGYVHSISDAKRNMTWYAHMGGYWSKSKASKEARKVAAQLMVGWDIVKYRSTKLLAKGEPAPTKQKRQHSEEERQKELAMLEAMYSKQQAASQKSTSKASSVRTPKPVEVAKAAPEAQAVRTPVPEPKPAPKPKTSAASTESSQTKAPAVVIKPIAPKAKPAVKPKPVVAPKTTPKDMAKVADLAQAVVEQKKAPAAAAGKSTASKTATKTKAVSKAAKKAGTSGPRVKKVYKGRAWIAQLYAFADVNNARSSARKYEKRGHKPFIIKLYDNSHKAWYMVNIAHGPTKDSIRKAARAFRTKEKISPKLKSIKANFLQERDVAF